jgi:hypothetical protein
MVSVDLIPYAHYVGQHVIYYCVIISNKDKVALITMIVVTVNQMGSLLINAKSYLSTALDGLGPSCLRNAMT